MVKLSDEDHLAALGHGERARGTAFVLHAMHYERARRAADLFSLLNGGRDFIWSAMNDLAAAGYVARNPSGRPGSFVLTAPGKAAARAFNRVLADEWRAAQDADPQPKGAA